MAYNFLQDIQQPYNIGNFGDNIAYPGGSATFDESTGMRRDPWSGQTIPYDGTINMNDWVQPNLGSYDPDPYDQTDQNRNWDGNWAIPFPGEGSGSTGGTDWGSILRNIIGGGGSGGLNLQALLPALYASQRGADEMNEQAGRYENLGREAVNIADPWGNDTRKYYQGKLTEMLDDPTKSPVYQSMMREAMGALGPRLAAQGRAGTDAGSGDWLRSIGDVANKYTGEWADRYGRFGGSEINPAQAASMLMEGGRQAGDARAQALAARLYPLGMFGGQGGPGGSGGGGSPGGGGSNPINSAIKWIQDALKGNKISPTDASSLLRMLGSNAGSLAGLWSGGTPVGPGIGETTGYDVWEGTPWSRTVLDAQEPDYGSWYEPDTGGGGYDYVPDYQGSFDGGFSIDDALSFYGSDGPW